MLICISFASSAALACQMLSVDPSIGVWVPISGVPDSVSTQTHLWRLGLLKSVPLGYLCDNPLPIHMSRGPPPPPARAIWKLVC